MVGRITTTVLLLVLACLLPWWVAVIGTLAALFYFKAYYEAVFIGLVFDAMYGSYVLFPALPYVLTLATLGIVYVATTVRARMIMY
ncbi:MAG: hypothetical protein RL150_230 [Candidatus Parcubacteria bacterium]|jgi:hypothetical protein